MSQPDNQGLHSLDLLDLPPLPRAIMRLLLRRGEMTHQELQHTVPSLPEVESPSQAEIDSAIEHLSQQQMLTRSGTDEAPSYKANIRRKPSRSSNIWDVLDSL